MIKFIENSSRGSVLHFLDITNIKHVTVQGNIVNVYIHNIYYKGQEDKTPVIHLKGDSSDPVNVKFIEYFDADKKSKLTVKDFDCMIKIPDENEDFEIIDVTKIEMINVYKVGQIKTVRIDFGTKNIVWNRCVDEIIEKYEQWLKIKHKVLTIEKINLQQEYQFEIL